MILLFDIDGTLIHTGGAGGSALRHAFQVQFGTEPGDVPFSGRTDRGIGRSLFELHGIEDSTDNWQRLRDEYLRQLPRHLHRKTGRVLPGVRELLEWLRPRDDVWTGLLTGNLRGGADLKLDYYKLSDHFDFGGFGDHHCDRDDVARAALSAAHDAVLPDPADLPIWVIGDTPLDVRCARAIGARVLAVTTGIHPAEELAVSEPDVLFDDLSQTDSVIEVLGIG